jgi:protein SHQ1
MPIVPKFSIDQNDEYVLVTIRVPYVKVSAAELVTDGTEFTFYCKPYLLKLSFPYEFEGEDERCKATYDPDNENGTLVAYLPKKVHGQVFPELDLTTKLLQARKDKDNLDMQDDPAAPSIEVLSSIENEDEYPSDVDNNNSEEVISPGIVTNRVQYYGFNNRYCSMFKNLKDHIKEIFELENPETSSHVSRRLQRLMKENELFDGTRYLGDLFGCEEDDIFLEAMKYEPFWNEQWNIWKSERSADSKSATTALADTVQETSGGSSGMETAVAAVEPTQSDRKNNAFNMIGGFSDIESEIMSHSLPRKQYIIATGSREERSLLLGLADVLFAFCYEYRITMGEFNVESVDNVCRLSATLSWLDWFGFSKDNARAVLIYSARRSLIYPYLRVFKFTRKVWVDVAKILVLGKKCILKSLLQLRNLFEHTDSHYLLNKLFIDDYCVWLQTVDSDSISNFAREYNDANTSLETITSNVQATDAPVVDPNSIPKRTLIQEITENPGSSSAVETKLSAPQTGPPKKVKPHFVGKSELRLNLVELEGWANDVVNKKIAGKNSSKCADSGNESSDDSDSDEEEDEVESEEDEEEEEEDEPDFEDIPPEISELPPFDESYFNHRDASSSSAIDEDIASRVERLLICK